MTVQLDMSKREDGEVQKTVTVSLWDADGNDVVTPQSVDFTFSTEETEQTQTVSFNVSDLHLWSAETPYLYTVVVSQSDGDGEESVFSTKYGFRDVAIRDGLVYINGQQVYFKGVNTQDTHPVTGRTMDVETMLTDVKMMKQSNMNIVRTSHYPRQPKMYAMFDYYGLYCMDEADIECHKNWSDGMTMTVSSSWTAAYVDRMMRMVKRDINHPSVVFWSSGNESGYGLNFAAVYDAAKEVDDRPVHYEGATRGGQHGEATDFYSTMYRSISETTSYANNNSEKQPYFKCEYAHAMGNAVGNLQEYWDVIESSRYGIGGCIWDWVDQSIYDPDDIKTGNLTVNGLPNYKAGYDFPGTTSDGMQGNFSNNGVIPADRSWSAKLTEVKKVYQYVKFEGYDEESGILTVRNKYDFTNLDNFGLRYSLLEDGNEIATAELSVPSTEPDETASIPVELNYTAEDGKEYFVTFEFYLKEATSWADAGYTVAAEQFALTTERTLPEVSTTAQLTMTERSGRVLLQGDNFTMEFYNGRIRRWYYTTSEGTFQMLRSGSYYSNDQYLGPVFNDYRYIENDRYTSTSSGESSTSSSSFEASLSDDGTYATVTVEVGGSKCPYTIEYTVYANGVVEMQPTFSPGGSQLRRIGLQMNFYSYYDDVEYYARGPWANYVDRRTGSFYGRYTTTVDDMFEEYTRPQSNANRCGLRELILTNPDNGLGFKVETEGQVDFSLSYYEDADYYKGEYVAFHPYDLTKSGYIVAHFDYMQEGLGNASNGPEPLDEYYCPTDGQYSYTLRFTPMFGDDTAVGIDKPLTQNDIHYDYISDTVTCKGDFADGTQVSLYNLGGVRLAATTAGSGTSEVSLSLSGLPLGSYIVVVNGPDGKRVHKFMK